MLRRDFLLRTGQIIGASALASACRSSSSKAALAPVDDLQDWESVRAQFDLDPGYYELAGFFLSAHPRAVRESIEAHRRGFDRNPHGYFEENAQRAETETLAEAATFLDVDPTDIALTDSTTMGLGLLYTGLVFESGDEIVTTPYDHYSTQTALGYAAERTGAKLVITAPFQDTATVTVDEIVGGIVSKITPRTRIVAITWVHSCTGVRMPVARIAEALGAINAKREERERILLCVDGVHGLGAMDATMPELGCDFFVAGTHKWLFGPRGTGLVWGKPAAWKRMRPAIPTFTWEAYRAWMEGVEHPEIAPGRLMTPGGFHSFEHRWSVAPAFRMQQAIGRARIDAHIHQMNGEIKQGLAEMKHVRLRTPQSHDLSAGIVCFEVEGMDPWAVVERLGEKRKVQSTVSPYAVHYCRLSAGLTTAPGGIQAALDELRSMG